MSYTYEQIEQIIGYGFGVESFYELCSHLPGGSYNDTCLRSRLKDIFDDYIGKDDEVFDNLPEDMFFSVEVMRTAPGGEAEMVIFFPRSDIYIKLIGHYSSYGYAELDMYRVYPVQEVVTNYYS